MTPVTGSCLCGGITYRITGPLRPVIACHCTQCPKGSGHHFAATSAARSDINIQGDVTWYASSDRAKRGFCGTCGSNLFWDGGGQNISIFAGTLDGDPGVKIVGHIFCDDKGTYYDVNDDAPKAAGYDPDLTTRVG
jgi:hypothetical protein